MPVNALEAAQLLAGRVSFCVASDGFYNAACLRTLSGWVGEVHQGRMVGAFR